MAKLSHVDVQVVNAGMNGHGRLPPETGREDEYQPRIEVDASSLAETPAATTGRRSMTGIEPAFMLSAAQPRFVTLDEADPTRARLWASLRGFGQHSNGNQFSLPAQVEDDQFVLAYAPAALDDMGDITSISEAIWSHSALMLWVKVRDLPPDHQLLLVFGARKLWAFDQTPIDMALQLYVGTKWTRSEPIDDQTEILALLLDAPELSTTSNTTDAFFPDFFEYVVYLRLASSHPDCGIGITGIHGYTI